MVLNAQPKWHESCEVSRHQFNYCNFGRMPIYGVDGKLGRNSESRLVHHNKEEAALSIDKNCYSYNLPPKTIARPHINHYQNVLGLDLFRFVHGKSVIKSCSTFCRPSMHCHFSRFMMFFFQIVWNRRTKSRF